MTLITSNLKTYRVYISMRHRCNNPKNANYPDYGNRGIFVCDEWGTFEQFLSDMGAQPTGCILDRKDNDGPYSPDNCRWVTHKESARNTRRNRLVTAFGITACVSEWSERTGINKITIIHRLNNGWSQESAVSVATSSKRNAAPLMRQAGLST